MIYNKSYILGRRGQNHWLLWQLSKMWRVTRTTLPCLTTTSRKKVGWLSLNRSHEWGYRGKRFPRPTFLSSPKLNLKHSFRLVKKMRDAPDVSKRLTVMGWSCLLMLEKMLFVLWPRGFNLHIEYWNVYLNYIFWDFYPNTWGCVWNDVSPPIWKVECH